MNRGGPDQGPFQGVNEIGLGPGDKLDMSHGQLGENLKIDVAHIENEQRIGLQNRQNLGPEALIMSIFIRGIPNLGRKPGSQVQQTRDPARQRVLRQVPQQSDLANQCIQGRAIHRLHLAIMRLSPGNFRRHRPLAFCPACLHLRQDREQDLQKQIRGQAAQALRKGLLAHFARRSPQHRFRLKSAGPSRSRR